MKKERRIIESTMCGFRSKLCLLDFIDCPDLFITDTGVIWSRQNIKNTWKDPVLYRKYINMTYPDKYCREPWVLLNDSNKMLIWLPVVHLLGLAFHNDKEYKYYYLKEPGVLHASNVYGSDEEDYTKVDKRSHYYSWVDKGDNVLEVL